MHFDLTDNQAQLLLAELDRIIEYDRYPLSPRIAAPQYPRDAEVLPGTPVGYAAAVLRTAQQGPL